MGFHNGDDTLLFQCGHDLLKGVYELMPRLGCVVFFMGCPATRRVEASWTHEAIVGRQVGGDLCAFFYFVNDRLANG